MANQWRFVKDCCWVCLVVCVHAWFDWNPPFHLTCCSAGRKRCKGNSFLEQRVWTLDSCTDTVMIIRSNHTQTKWHAWAHAHKNTFSQIHLHKSMHLLSIMVTSEHTHYLRFGLCFETTAYVTVFSAIVYVHVRTCMCDMLGSFHIPKGPARHSHVSVTPHSWQEW